jgi:hypothetical protein
MLLPGMSSLRLIDFLILTMVLMLIANIVIGHVGNSYAVDIRCRLRPGDVVRKDRRSRRRRGDRSSR